MVEHVVNASQMNGKYLKKMEIVQIVQNILDLKEEEEFVNQTLATKDKNCFWKENVKTALIMKKLSEIQNNVVVRFNVDQDKNWV